MSPQPVGQIRRSQAITTWGPGALIDLPRHSGIVGGLDTWPSVNQLDEIVEPRLTRRLTLMTGVASPRLYSPPADTAAPWEQRSGITLWRFPEWMVVQEKQEKQTGNRRQGRLLVHRRALDERGRFDGRAVVPTRFVRACQRGHVQDVNWRSFLHGPGTQCTRQMWLEERGTSGDLADLVVRCDCGAGPRGMQEAAETGALGPCWGARPWLGPHTAETCGLPSRLLIRTASNAYFAHGMTALSLPERGAEIDEAVQSQWATLQVVNDLASLAVMRRLPAVAAALAGHSDEEVLDAIERLRDGAQERPVKLAELDALLAAPEGYGEDVPVDPDFHARRLPPEAWRRPPVTDRIAAVVQLHRLREVIVQIGFTRLEAIVPDINGEYDPDGPDLAPLALEPQWFPAVENRGEGLLLALDSDAVQAWLGRPGVAARIDQLLAGWREWAARRGIQRPFPGGPYVLVHTLSHLLLTQLAMRCGYPASSLRERIYVDQETRQYAVLIYTASTDAEGTLGGLVSQARHISSHLELALAAGGLCSNDPVCAQHAPGEGMEERWLHGAACHGCALIAETACEMRNDLLDRALVVPTLAVPDAAFFDPVL